MKRVFYGVIAVAIVGIIIAAFALPSWSKTPPEEFDELQQRVQPFMEEKFAEEKNAAVEAVKAKMVAAVNATGVEVKDAVITAAPTPNSESIILTVLTTEGQMENYPVEEPGTVVNLLFAPWIRDNTDLIQKYDFELVGDKFVITTN